MADHLYYVDLARDVISQSVNKLEHAESYLARANAEDRLAVNPERQELSRLIVRLQRINRGLVSAVWAGANAEGIATAGSAERSGGAGEELCSRLA